MTLEKNFAFLKPLLSVVCLVGAIITVVYHFKSLSTHPALEDLVSYQTLAGCKLAHKKCYDKHAANLLKEVSLHLPPALFSQFQTSVVDLSQAKKLNAPLHVAIQNCYAKSTSALMHTTTSWWRDVVAGLGFWVHMYVVGRSLLHRNASSSKVEDLEISLNSLIQAINSVNERVLEIKRETAENIREVIRNAEKNGNFLSFYGELRLEVNKALLAADKLAMEVNQLKAEKIRKSFSEKIKALPWKSESPQSIESSSSSPSKEVKKKLDAKADEKAFNLTDDSGIQEWKKYVEQNVSLIRRSFRSSPLSPLCPNSVGISSESAVSTSLTTGTTRFLANQRKEQENQLKMEVDATEKQIETTEDKERKRYDWLFQSSIFQNEGPVKVIQGVKTVDRSGKPHRRIFVPGTGWTSAKKLAQEKCQGKVIVEPETNHIV